jgi:hypothetical protein
LEEHWKRADVRLRFGFEKATITTSNVSRMTLSFGNPIAPFRHGPFELTVDGTRFSKEKVRSNVRLVKTGNRWKSETSSQGLQKAPQLQGPIDDAFMDSFIVVRPTGKPMNVKTHAWIEDELAHATNEWRNQFRGHAIVKADTEISDEDIANNHLILWGDPESNKLLRRIARKLPASWSRDTIRIAGKKFEADKFVPLFIFPNPLNPKRYVVVNSGFTFCEYGRSSNALQIPKLPDYAVLDIAVDRKSRYTNGVALAGFFNEKWEL